MNGSGVPRRHVAVGDDRATPAESEPGASAAQPGEEAGTNVDTITAVAERYIDAAHAPRIGRQDLAASFRLPSDAEAVA